ncbi:putative two-component system sensor kinase [Streptomyces zinciresistens K42]|uniref:histidine kinase n=1 Tax=Streptomyces zinciresistens K42 TaxID=700597 RepID=G2GK67_9ACTN|nr:histidine kinase [Streptomyces zinciresistens]EGX56088.1 putative two-component system sensor kinase [Streptomyces zinciresistens K42]
MATTIPQAPPPTGPRHPAWRLLAAAALGVPFWFLAAIQLPYGYVSDGGYWFVTGDPLVALGCLGLLAWRRRRPLPVALVVAAASAVSVLAAGAVFLALVSVAAHRRPVWTGSVVAVYLVAAQGSMTLYPLRDGPPSPWLALPVCALSAGAAVAVGLAVAARRAEVVSLRERALSAEREQSTRAAHARAEERTRIAREMHDVLAHRISRVALQAGVLDHRGDLTAEENSLLVRSIRDGSHQALEELRDVLGVLRSDPGRPDLPKPSLASVPDLVAEARATGLDADLTSTVAGDPPDPLGRTCYRVVQEGLSNAAKHAPGSRVRVTVDGAPGDGLRVTVRNSAAPAARTAALPRSGYGLLGLTERVTLAGGELRHHPASDGGHLLTARLPWPDPGGKRT